MQGSDSRLNKASTERFGIVELAQNGEDKEGVVVQGHDRRLKAASLSQEGIVQLASHDSTQPGLVVQADDKRLSDARQPLPHTHEYAPVDHDFNSHPGMIRLEKSTGKQYQGHVPPPIDHSPISAVNTGGGSAISGRSENDGILGFGHQSGLRGISDRGVGVLGQSFSGAGAQFTSARSYDVMANSLNEESLGLFVGGISRLQGSIYGGLESIGSVLAVSLPVHNTHVVLPGDVLIASIIDGQVQKCQHRSSPKVVGIAVDKASIVLGMPDQSFAGEEAILQPEGRVLVAVAGVVMARVSAEVGPVEPGDLLVTSFQPGCLETIANREVSSNEPGRIVAISLGSVKKGESMIQVVLRL
ncbi:MAG: hypothetical protein H3C43_00980 [Leptonema sp. (in: Bacteria)]|nr:hypothetical protein [Leptonema sp. (in: bacteria)]